MNTIARIVKCAAGVFAVTCADGNGPKGAGEDNGVILTPVSEHAKVTPETLKPGVYLVRVNRLLAQGTADNESAEAGLRAVVAHPNSKWIGKDWNAVGIGSVSRTGTSAKVGTGYVGTRKGGESSPGGWTLVYYNGS